MTIPFEPKRGCVCKILIDFPDRAAQSNERHMFVVVQSDKLKQQKNFNIAMITSNTSYIRAPFNVPLPPNTLSGCQPELSMIKCDFLYVATRDKLRRGKYCGQIPDKIMKEIDDAIIFSLGLVEDE